ncbi:MAG TPA: hypothetical protein VHC95_07010 [Opitutales bacterium]|nr:hypothetical protein [Opitutales bacterium]
MLRAEASTLSLICQIQRLNGDNYLNLLAREKFNSGNWRNLPAAELEQIRAILLSRRAAKERAAREEKQQLKLPF